MQTAEQKKQQAYRRGIAAEHWCALLLRVKGYQILAQRLRTPGGEIDILARKGKTLAIVEVKAHRKLRDSIDAITAHKRQRLEQAALHTLASRRKFAGRNDLHTLNIRFDLMAMRPRRLPYHLKNAWRN